MNSMWRARRMLFGAVAFILAAGAAGQTDNSTQPGWPLIRCDPNQATAQGGNSTALVPPALAIQIGATSYNWPSAPRRGEPIRAYGNFSQDELSKLKKGLTPSASSAPRKMERSRLDVDTRSLMQEHEKSRPLAELLASGTLEDRTTLKLGAAARLRLSQEALPGNVLIRPSDIAKFNELAPGFVYATGGVRGDQFVKQLTEKFLKPLDDRIATIKERLSVELFPTQRDTASMLRLSRASLDRTGDPTAGDSALAVNWPISDRPQQKVSTPAERSERGEKNKACAEADTYLKGEINAAILKPRPNDHASSEDSKAETTGNFAIWYATATSEDLKSVPSNLRDAMSEFSNKCWSELSAESALEKRISGALGAIGFDDYRHCTGTLIEPNLVLTARHCFMRKSAISGKPVREFTSAEVSNSWFEPLEGKGARYQVCKLVSNAEPQQYAEKNDWITLTIAAPAGGFKSFTALPKKLANLDFGQRLVVPGLNLLAPQNVTPFPLKITNPSISGCEVIAHSNSCIAHNCQTLPGWSGAPVFLAPPVNGSAVEGFQLVGLHLGGREDHVDLQPGCLTKNGVATDQKGTTAKDARNIARTLQGIVP